jgi:hypothetical protein
MGFAADRRAILGALLPLHTCPVGHFKVTETCPVCLEPKPKRQSATADALSPSQKEHARMVARKLVQRAQAGIARRRSATQEGPTQ